jgi:hypothetical protein
VKEHDEYWDSNFLRNLELFYPQKFAKLTDYKRLSINSGTDYAFISDGIVYVFNQYTGVIRRAPADPEHMTDEQVRKWFMFQLRAAITEASLDSKSLAEEIGSTPCMISRYLNGTVMPNLITINKLANALHVPVSYFFYQGYDRLDFD